VVGCCGTSKTGVIWGINKKTPHEAGPICPGGNTTRGLAKGPNKPQGGEHRCVASMSKNVDVPPSPVNTQSDTPTLEALRLITRIFERAEVAHTYQHDEAIFWTMVDAMIAEARLLADIAKKRKEAVK
jgi:hypothetical protein